MRRSIYFLPWLVFILSFGITCLLWHGTQDHFLFFIMGIVASLLLAWVIWFLVHGRESALRVAEDMNAALRKSEEHLNQIVASPQIEAHKEIAERKQAEEKLKVSETRYRELVSSVTDYIYTVKLEGDHVVSTSHGRGCITVTGYSTEDYARDGALWYRMVHDEEKYLIERISRKLVIGQEVVPFEHRIIHKNGTVRWVRHTPVLRWDEGKLLGYDGLIADITERKRMEGALRVAKEQAEAANKAKSEFLLNISHDIRTPLNSILGLSSILTSVKMDEKYKKCVSIIQQQGKELLALVEDILQISKLESGRLALRCDEFDLSELVGRLMDGARLELRDKHVALSCVMPEGIPRLKGDALRVSQILSNVLSNAVKYTEKGEIKVTVAGFPDGMGKKYKVRVSVKDTGLGISTDKLPVIFDPFTRFHEFHGGKIYKGVGLGLNIVKTLVQLMGGDVKVLSEVGKGSEFVITLNMEQAG